MSELIFIDHPDKQIIDIEGVNYHYDFFRFIGHNLALNVPFKIVRRRDKSITIKEIKGCPFMKGG